MVTGRIVIEKWYYPLNLTTFQDSPNVCVTKHYHVLRSANIDFLKCQFSFRSYRQNTQGHRLSGSNCPFSCLSYLSFLLFFNNMPRWKEKYHKVLLFQTVKNLIIEKVSLNHKVCFFIWNLLQESIFSANTNSSSGCILLEIIVLFVCL